MFSSLMNVWHVPDLRRRLGFTFMIIALYRAGSWLPVPGVNTSSLRDFFGGGANGSILSVLNIFSGGALANLSLFALGIMPYITASIIIQLMQTVVPALEKLSKEGESGYKKITQYTRYLTVVLAALQSAGYVFLFHNGSAIGANDLLPDLTIGRFILIVTTLTAGTTLLMWMGELITQRGIGNGISLLIFASILTAAPPAIDAWLNGGTFEKLALPIVTLGVILAVVYMNEGQRRIPIQYAKRQVGRRMMSGGSTVPAPARQHGRRHPGHLRGRGAVLPVAGWAAGARVVTRCPLLAAGGCPAIILEFALTVMFTFLYTAVTFNPVDQADNLKKYGGFVPGVARRPDGALPRPRAHAVHAAGLDLPRADRVAAELVIRYAGSRRPPHAARRYIAPDRGGRRARCDAADGSCS